VPKPTAPLDAQCVRSLLAGTRFADVRYVAQTASTNTDALGVLGDAAALGATIVAEYQTAGSGRKGRRWFAPPGAALLFTALLPQPVAATALWAVPFWIALGVAAAVERTCGVALDLVWPNDVYARGGKLGGILSVARIAGSTAWVGCGVGLNVVRPVGDRDLDALRPAPTFLDDLVRAPSREQLLAAILRGFDATLDWLDDPADVAARWAERSGLAGTVYRYRRDSDSDSDGVEREGIAQRIGAQGTLVLRDAHGEVTVDMADVRVIGRAPAADLPAQ
jgi:BirA family biotin operon repressor/biotin-[acetyl-CoA-carboxylase] ligase